MSTKAVLITKQTSYCFVEPVHQGFSCNKINSLQVIVTIQDLEVKYSNKPVGKNTPTSYQLQIYFHHNVDPVLKC